MKKIKNKVNILHNSLFENMSEECSICFNTQPITHFMEFTCTHKFCYHCIFQLLSKLDENGENHMRCALCRKYIDDNITFFASDTKRETYCYFKNYIE
jgi:hypothetical protein